MIGGMVARHTLVRERPTRVADGRGNERSDFTGVEPVELRGWALDAGSTVRNMEHRDGAKISWTARGPYTVDVERFDRITVFGEPFMIEGAVLRQPGPTGRTSHTILFLAKWKG